MEMEMPLKDYKGWIKVVLISCTEEEFERTIKDAVDYKVSKETPPSRVDGETIIYYDNKGLPIAMKTWFRDLKTGKESKCFYKITPFNS